MKREVWVVEVMDGDWRPYVAGAHSREARKIANMLGDARVVRYVPAAPAPRKRRGKVKK